MKPVATLSYCLLLALAFGITSTFALADDDAKATDVDKKQEESTVEAKGTFVASVAVAVELKPEEWSDFKIAEVVPHGTEVHKGQILVEFEGKKIKEAIDELELELQIEELNLIKAEVEVPRTIKKLEESFEQAERNLENAKADYDHYREVERKLNIKGIEMRLKGTKQSVENIREELRQLEKMYEADDITEETEEIILHRQRAAVEQANFRLEQAILSHDRELEVVLPRTDIAKKEALEEVEKAFEAAKLAVKTEVNRARYDLQKQKRAHQKNLEKHAKLTSDLSLLTLKAPIDGVVYYGKSKNGKWSEVASLIEKYQPEGAASAGTLMTIVAPGPLLFVTTVGEADLLRFEKGKKAMIQPTAAGSEPIQARVKSISPVMVDDGKFAMHLEVAEDHPEWLLPGMTGTATVELEGSDKSEE